MFELKAQLYFSAAHHLLNYDGECENQHGHNWLVEAYVKGEALDKSNILVDGATAYQTFFDITVPLLKPTIYFVTTVTAISSFQIFDLIYVMTQGGPNDSTNVIVYSIYKYAFEYFDIGKSCALAYILFAIILVLALVQKKFTKN